LVDFTFGILYLFCVLRVGVYGILGAGWSSNSKYALLGAIRSVAQTISYEVRLALILIRIVFLVMRYDFLSFKAYRIIIITFFPLFFC
jgi:NADH:ubiquinone oxidoreductase subunit H